ncbi:MAG: hypothetical protein ACI39H_00095 [Lachnospiraceae bacterium]
MTVQELIREVDIDRVIEAFLLVDYRFSGDNREKTLLERVSLVDEMTEEIHKFVEEILSYNVSKPIEEQTLFIFEMLLTNYEDRGEKTYDVFVIKDEEAFYELTREKKKELEELEHYDVDFSKTGEFLSYRISEYSLKEFGKEICAAFILSHMLKMGKSIEERDLNISKHAGKKDMTDEENDDSLSMNIKEFSEMLDRIFTAEMTEEEKEYFRMKDEFYSKTKVFRTKFEDKMVVSNRKKYTTAIYDEYKRKMVI